MQWLKRDCRYYLDSVYTVSTVCIPSVQPQLPSSGQSLPPSQVLAVTSPATAAASSALVTEARWPPCPHWHAARASDQLIWLKGYSEEDVEC